MSQIIIEKLEAIESAQAAKIEEVQAAAHAEVEAAKAELTEAVAALEAKVASVQAPAIIKQEKSVRADVNKMVKEQLNAFRNGARAEKEIKLFESEDQREA